MIDLDQILTGLIQRTEEGKLRWSRAAQQDRFITSVDAISVMIFETEGEHGFDILDESGEVVESLRYEDTSEEQDEQLERLYILARRSALNIDSVLEKLGKALELKSGSTY